MNELPIVDAKELCEVEGAILDVDERSAEQTVEIVSPDVEAREVGIGIVIGGVLERKIFLGALLVDVSPIEGPRGVKVVGEIEGRARQIEAMSGGLDESIKDFLAAFGLSALVSLVDDEQLPIDVEQIGVLTEIAADEIGAAKVLHRSEPDEGRAAIDQLVDGLAAGFRAEAVIGAGKNFFEVVEPAGIDDGLMSDDDRSNEGATLDDLERAERLAETHLGVPKNIFGLALVEVLDRHFDRVELFGTEDDRIDRLIDGDARQILSTVNDGVDGGDGGFEIDFEPLAGGMFFEGVGSVARTLEDVMNVVISEGRMIVGDGKTSVEEIVIDGDGVGVIFDALVSGAVEIGFLGSADAFQRCLADLQ